MTALSWVGLGIDTKLSTAANLSPAQVPVAGDSIDFPAAATGICTFDMGLAFLTVSSDAASNIAITQTKKATFTGTFTIDGTGGTTWAQNGHEIQAAGYTDTGSAVVANTSNTYRATVVSIVTAGVIRFGAHQIQFDRIEQITIVKTADVQYQR